MGGRNKREEKESRGERMKRREREREGEGKKRIEEGKREKIRGGGRKSGATVEDLIDRLGAPAQYP